MPPSSTMAGCSGRGRLAAVGRDLPATGRSRAEDGGAEDRAAVRRGGRRLRGWAGGGGDGRAAAGSVRDEWVWVRDGVGVAGLIFCENGLGARESAETARDQFPVSFRISDSAVGRNQRTAESSFGILSFGTQKLGENPKRSRPKKGAEFLIDLMLVYWRLGTY